MKKTATTAAGIFIALALCDSAPLSAQNARMLDPRKTTLEWAYLDRILEGENIPTTIQSRSLKEALFYGLDTRTDLERETEIDFGTGALARLPGSARQHSHVFNLKTSWPIVRNREANADLDFRYILNAGNVAGTTRTETVYSTGFTWSYGRIWQ